MLVARDLLRAAGNSAFPGDRRRSFMICVNDGQFQVDWKEGMTVQSLLLACKFTYPMLLVTANGQVVPVEEYAIHRLVDGDEVKVLHLVSGG
jgi:sulfur carrier protein